MRSFVYILIIGFCIGCSGNKNTNAKMNELLEKEDSIRPILNKELLSKIDSVANIAEVKYSDEYNRFFFHINFYEENTEEKLLLFYDIRPPSLLGEDHGFIGYIKHKNNYLLFFDYSESKLSDRFIFDYSQLNPDINDLSSYEAEGIFDPTGLFYRIDKNNKLSLMQVGFKY